MSMRLCVLISGCRHYRKYFEFSRKLTTLLSGFKKRGIEIFLVEGGARGTDYLAYLYGLRHKIPVITVEADWDKYGKSAGFIRNKEMMEMCTHAIAFWDGVSSGTKHVVSHAIDFNVSLKVITIDKEVKDGKYRKSNRLRRPKNERVVS